MHLRSPLSSLSKSTVQALKLSSRSHVGKLGNKCAYCGIYAETVDHIIPVSFFGERKYDLIKHKMNENLVRACSECNNLASNQVFGNFWEKKSFISNKVHDRYKDLLNSPEWKDHEIEELNGQLKSFVKQGKIMKEFIRIRLENLNSPEICQ